MSMDSNHNPFSDDEALNPSEFNDEPDFEDTAQSLSPEDRRAIDRLVDSGWSPDDGDLGAGKVAALLGGLDGVTLPEDRTLVDVTMVRVARRWELERREPELTPADADALDAWVLAGFDPAKVPGSLKQRAAAHERLASMVTAGGSAPGFLIDQTLARVREVDEALLEPIPIGRNRGGRVRFWDFVAVAASLVIGASVLWPVMNSVREESRQTVCANNMRASAFAMGSYAGANRDALPMASAGLPGRLWWNVGRPEESNSANLFELSRQDYVGLDSLACPGNRIAPTRLTDPAARDWRRLEEVSYSYRIMFGNDRPQWSSPSSVVLLADRSPVVQRAVLGQPIHPMENSHNHGRRGQNVLFNDGSVVWLETPELANGDNIWLPRDIEILLDHLSGRRAMPLNGFETPAGVEDAFVGP